MDNRLFQKTIFFAIINFSGFQAQTMSEAINRCFYCHNDYLVLYSVNHVERNNFLLLLGKVSFHRLAIEMETKTEGVYPIRYSYILYETTGELI